MKLLELNKCIIDIFNEYTYIDYFKYKIFCNIDINFKFTDTFNKYLKLSPPAIEFFQLGEKNVSSVSRLKIDNILMNNMGVHFRKYLIFDFVTNKLNFSDKILLITNVEQSIHLLNSYKKPFDTLLFKNEESRLGNSYLKS